MASDCVLKGEPAKGSEWACNSGSCAEVKVAAKRKGKAKSK
jgi:hypothetical protein